MEVMYKWKQTRKKEWKIQLYYRKDIKHELQESSVYVSMILSRSEIKTEKIKAKYDKKRL